MHASAQPEFVDTNNRSIERLLAFGKAIATRAIETHQPVSFLIEGPFYVLPDGQVAMDVSRLQVRGVPGWEVVAQSSDGTYDLWFNGHLEMTCKTVDEAVRALDGKRCN